jgi:hypothetical protein
MATGTYIYSLTMQEVQRIPAVDDSSCITEETGTGNSNISAHAVQRFRNSRQTDVLIIKQ